MVVVEIVVVVVVVVAEVVRSENANFKTLLAWNSNCARCQYFIIFLFFIIIHILQANMAGYFYESAVQLHE